MLSRFYPVSADSAGLSVAGLASSSGASQKQQRGRLVDKPAAAFLDARFNEVDDTQMVMSCQAKTVVSLDRLRAKKPGGEPPPGRLFRNCVK
jgi:hypothetical protein